eukprot:13080415-Alexandrium_andersonii.AAC.1
MVVNLEPGPRWIRGSLRQFAPGGSNSETVVNVEPGPRWRAAVRIDQILNTRPYIRRRRSRPP